MGKTGSVQPSVTKPSEGLSRLGGGICAVVGEVKRSHWMELSAPPPTPMFCLCYRETLLLRCSRSALRKICRRGAPLTQISGGLSGQVGGRQGSIAPWPGMQWRQGRWEGFALLRSIPKTNPSFVSKHRGVASAAPPPIHHAAE